MLLTIQSTLIIPHLCSSSWSQFQFFLFLLSGEFPSKVSQSHLQAENKTHIWLFSDVASIGLQQKVILQDVMLFAFCSFKNHKPVCLRVWLLPKPTAVTTELTVRTVSGSHTKGSSKAHSLSTGIPWAWAERGETRLQPRSLCLMWEFCSKHFKDGLFFQSPQFVVCSGM